MANRPVFKAILKTPYVDETDVKFKFHSGFSIQQKRRSIKSLHDSFLEHEKGLRVLEISSKSDVDLGVKLSAFNLLIEHRGVGTYSVESAFQSSKVFERGGPFKDLLLVSSRDAKRDPRLRENGRLQSFNFFSRNFPLEPKTYFYDWLYAHALWSHKTLLEEVVQFDAFTDIEYNPKKSINCQARAVAKVVGLWRKGLLGQSLENPTNFLSIGYPMVVKEANCGNPTKEASVQEPLF